jgi:hypothetical protein
MQVYVEIQPALMQKRMDEMEKAQQLAEAQAKEQAEIAAMNQSQDNTVAEQKL